jgi:TetR/AcrR family transcriptional regulator
MTPAHDPEATRARILDAAEAAFSGAGFPGARVDAIARSAGVNKRMLYHYYGNKAGLYSAAIDRLVRRVFDKMEHALSEAEFGDPVSAVTSLLETFFDVAYTEPHYVKLFAREAADEWQGAAALECEDHSKVTTEAMHTLFERVVPVLRRGMVQGVLRADLEPGMVSILVVLLCRSFLLMLPQLDAYHPVALQEPEGLSWAKRHIVTLLLDGLRARTPLQANDASPLPADADSGACDARALTSDGGTGPGGTPA